MREATAFFVAKHSIARRLTIPIPIFGLELEGLRDAGLYSRPTQRRTRDDGSSYLFDEISGAPMSTEFAISRFLTPILAKSGWALFLDADILARGNLARMFDEADSSKAVICVQHPELPGGPGKMDGQAQQPYARKNWSSVMLFNCDHPANRALTVEMINTVPGRDLHRFCWLEDRHIGALRPEWNWLVGHSSEAIDPVLVHFTEGFPLLPGYEQQPYADDWRKELRHLATRDRWPR